MADAMLAAGDTVAGVAVIRTDGGPETVVDVIAVPDRDLLAQAAGFANSKWSGGGMGIRIAACTITVGETLRAG